jgi:recombination protein RecT
LSAALLGESLNLSPSPQLGHFYLIPFDDRKAGTKKASFILGAKGYIQMAVRSGAYKSINVMSVKKGELKRIDRFGEVFEFEYCEDDILRNTLPTIGYYASFKLPNGFCKEVFWSREKMQSHAKRYSKAYAYDLSKGYKSSIWSTDFDTMGEKTMLRQLISKWGILSTQIANAVENDGASVSIDPDSGNFVQTETPEYIEKNPQAEPSQPQAEPAENSEVVYGLSDL